MSEQTNPAPAVETPAAPQYIDAAAYFAADHRIGRVVEESAIEGADKLLKLKVDFGNGEFRTIVAGIKEAYAGGLTLGKQYLFVTNLPPRKMKGVVSEGMILAAKDGDGKPVLLTPEKPVPTGSKVS